MTTDNDRRTSPLLRLGLCLIVGSVLSSIVLFAVTASHQSNVTLDSTMPGIDSNVGGSGWLAGDLTRIRHSREVPIKSALITSTGYLTTYLPMVPHNYCVPPPPPVNVSNTPDSSRDPAIAIDRRGTVHVVWNESSGDNSFVYYAQSPFTGSSQAVSTVSGPYGPPSIAVDPASTVHVVWATNTSSELEIYHTFKAPDGDWSTPRIIAQRSSVNRNSPPVLTSGCETGVHLVWTNSYLDSDPSGRYWIFHAQIASDGTMLGSPEAVGYSEAIDTVYVVLPDVVVDAACTLHMVYNDWAGWDSKWDIFYRKKPKGRGWTSPTSIESIYEDAHVSAIAVDPEESLHVVWSNYTPNSPEWSEDIYYINKRVGYTWSSPENITNNSSGVKSHDPVIAADHSQNLHAVSWVNGCFLKYMYKPVNGAWISLTLHGPDRCIMGRPDIAVGLGVGAHIVLSGYYDVHYLRQWCVVQSED